MVTKGDYDALQVEAARSVLLELVRLLGEYRDDMVVVGGWVPAATPSAVCSWVAVTARTTSNRIGSGVR